MIKALLQKKKKKEQTDYWGNDKEFRMVMLYNPKMGEEKQIKKGTGRMQSPHCAEVCQHSSRTIDSKWQL